MSSAIIVSQKLAKVTGDAQAVAFTLANRTSLSRNAKFYHSPESEKPLICAVSIQPSHEKVPFLAGRWQEISTAKLSAFVVSDWEGVTTRKVRGYKGLDADGDGWGEERLE